MKNWLKLDNAAKIYPPTRRRNWAFMFRLSVTLSEPVDKEVLEAAQVRTLARFPSFACRLKRGAFWYYLEHMDGAPEICDDGYTPLETLNPRKNRHFLYRPLCCENRISVEFFHALTDGTGGMTFLLSLVAEYLREKHGEQAECSKYILSCEDEPCPEEFEDSFIRYARDESVSRNEKISYHNSGTDVPFHKLLFVSGSVPTAALLDKAKEHGVSLGVFLAALLMQAVYKRQLAEKSARKRKQLLKVSVPVNLRRFFPSKTLRNFSAYVSPALNSRFGRYEFDEILSQVKHQMGISLTEKELNAKFSENVKSEKNFFMRIVPLFIKNQVLKLAFLLQGERYYASTISNFGEVVLPENMKKYVNRIDFMLGRPLDKRTTCACLSYNGTTIFNFTRTMLETDVERNFFTSLVEMGVPVSVEGNK